MGSADDLAQAIGGPAASQRVVEHMTAPVRTVAAGATLREAARSLAAHAISCLVVVESERPVGILCERDLVRLAADDPAGWSGQQVDSVMSRPVHTISRAATIAQALSDLARRRVRHLPVVDDDGRLTGIVTQTDLVRAAHRGLHEYSLNLERVVRDRTTDLRESEGRRDDLVDLTVHDIKNSLCVIDSVLEMEGLAPAEVAMTVPLLRRASARIGRLVCTLLELNRLESGTMPLRLTEIPWAMVCEPVLAEAGVMAQAKSLAFNRSGQSHALVCCDAQLVERVLLNLLDNAVTAAPEGSTIDIHAERRRDGSFLVRVGNRGPLIPSEMLPLLFSKYRSGSGERPLKRLGGWGLGLTFCRLAVERHGGTIRAVSPYVDGEGVAFELVLPGDPRA